MAGCPSCGRTTLTTRASAARAARLSLPPSRRASSARSSRSSSATRWLDRARRVDRSGGAPRAHAPLLRRPARDRRAARRRRREVRRRRGHGGLRDPGRARGRRAPRRPCRGRDARCDRRSTGSRRGSASTPARSSSAGRARRSSPATRSTSPPGSSRPPPPARRLSARGREPSSAMPSVSSPSSPSRSRASRSRSRPSACSRSSETPTARPPPGDAARRPRARAEPPVARLRGRRCRPLVPALHAARPGGDRQVATGRGLPRARRRLGGRPPRALPLLRGGHHLLAARRDPRRDRRRARLGDRHVTSRDAARLPPAARGARVRSDRRSSSSTTCSGRSRCSSIWSSTSQTSHATRRSFSSVSRARSCSTRDPPGAAGSSTRRRSSSSRSGQRSARS